jgi:hypothetical protein
MWNTVLTLLAIGWPPVAAWLVLKFLPSSIITFVEKEIERRSDEKLERAKAEIQGSYATLKTSVDLLSATNSGMHPHIIDSVKVLWKTIVHLRSSFGGLTAFDSIIVPGEAENAFKDQENSEHMLGFVRAHQGDLQNPVRAAEVFAEDLNTHRLFCGDRLWLVFYVVRAVLLRSSLLVAMSFKNKEFQDWRKDDGIKQLLETVLPVDFVTNVRASQFGGLQKALDQLEADFLHEATRVMSGSKAMADSLANLQAIMLLQNAKIAER